MPDTSPMPITDPLNSVAGTMEVAAHATRRGAADAAEAANRTYEAAGLFLKRFVYTTCYTIAYGVVFPSVLLARSVPRDNAAVRGLIDGADAARHKVEEVASTSPTFLGGSSPAALPAS